jgi:hypothetical protein
LRGFDVCRFLRPESNRRFAADQAAALAAELREANGVRVPDLRSVKVMVDSCGDETADGHNVAATLRRLDKLLPILRAAALAPKAHDCSIIPSPRPVSGNTVRFLMAWAASHRSLSLASAWGTRKRMPRFAFAWPSAGSLPVVEGLLPNCGNSPQPGWRTSRRDRFFGAIFPSHSHCS